MSASSSCAPWPAAEDVTSSSEWQIRWLDAHAPFAAAGSRSLSNCAHLPSDAAEFAEPHHAHWVASGWASRLPYLTRGDINATRILWPGARHPPPRSIVALWKAHGEIAVTAGGALYAPRTRRLYVQHPEYHAPPPCAPTAAALAAAPRHRRAVALTQAYGANHWHLLAELLPRALMVRPLLAADAGAALLLPPGATAAARELLVLLGADPASIHPMTTELVVAGALAFPTYAPFSWHTEPPAAPIRALRAALLAALPPPPPPPCEGGVLLALREERDVDNWDEAARALRAAGRCVVAERALGLPVAAQAALFRTARVLVGSHGANLANMIFAQGPLAVLELPAPPPRPPFRNYAHLAAVLGFEHWILEPRGAGVDVGLLVRTVTRVYENEDS